MAKRNKALDSWLDASKAVNQELAEDPEAREAAAAQAAAAGEDSAHVDPTDNEIVDPNDDNDGNPDATPEATAEPDEAARAAAEAAAAAEREAKGETVASPDERDRQLKNSQEESKRLKREKDELKRQLADIRRQQAEAQNRPDPAPAAAPAAAETSKAPNDPEPNPDTHPVEHDQWLAREARRDAAVAREEIQSLRAEMDTVKAGNQQQQMERDFVSLMDQEKVNYKADHPDFDARLDHVKGALRQQMRINGVPAHQIETQLHAQEVRFLVGQTTLAQQQGEPYPGRYALDRLAELAETYGYHETEGSGDAETPAPKNGTKPAPTAAAQVEDRAKRASAARTATTMSGTPPETHDPNAPMDAVRFLKMKWAEREAYKRQHPGTLDKIFGEGEEQGGVNPLLAGR